MPHYLRKHSSGDLPSFAHIGNLGIALQESEVVNDGLQRLDFASFEDLSETLGFRRWTGEEAGERRSCCWLWAEVGIDFGCCRYDLR